MCVLWQRWGIIHDLSAPTYARCNEARDVLKMPAVTNTHLQEQSLNAVTITALFVLNQRASKQPNSTLVFLQAAACKYALLF